MQLLGSFLCSLLCSFLHKVPILISFRKLLLSFFLQGRLLHSFSFEKTWFIHNIPYEFGDYIHQKLIIIGDFPVHPIFYIHNNTIPDYLS